MAVHHSRTIRDLKRDDLPQGDRHRPPGFHLFAIVQGPAREGFTVNASDRTLLWTHRPPTCEEDLEGCRSEAHTGRTCLIASSSIVFLMWDVNILFPLLLSFKVIWIFDVRIIHFPHGFRTSPIILVRFSMEKMQIPMPEIKPPACHFPACCFQRTRREKLFAAV